MTSSTRPDCARGFAEISRGIAKLIAALFFPFAEFPCLSARGLENVWTREYGGIFGEVAERLTFCQTFWGDLV